MSKYKFLFWFSMASVTEFYEIQNLYIRYKKKSPKSKVDIRKKSFAICLQKNWIILKINFNKKMSSSEENDDFEDESLCKYGTAMPQYEAGKIK